jgi:iron complex outermembrane receptor protein
LGLSSPPNTFDSDSLWSYEVGNKSRFLDNRVSINASLFYVKWKNIQQDVQLTTQLDPLCSFDFEGNFGNATSKGAEIEVRARPTSNLTVGMFGGFTSATFDADVPALGVQSGDQLQGVPKMNAALTADYRFFNGDNVTFFARGAVRWTGSSRGSSFDPTNSDYSRPSYKTVDASVGATFANNWEVSLFAKNLLNDQTILQQPTVQYATEAYRQRPRTIGVNVAVKM